jgi:hypothetical protein
LHIRDRFWRVVLPIGALGVLFSVLGAGYAAEPDRFVLGFSPAQPIPFSHKVHAGNGRIPCLYCHTGATRSRHAGVPALETCLNCHRVTRTDRPAIRELTRLFEQNASLAWQRVYSLPDHVFFDHRPHVRAGIACQTCHGEVEHMDRVSRQMRLKMGTCLDCHRDPRPALPKGSAIVAGPTNCGACHR